MSRRPNLSESGADRGTRRALYRCRRRAGGPSQTTPITASHTADVKPLVLAIAFLAIHVGYGSTSHGVSRTTSLA